MEIYGQKETLPLVVVGGDGQNLFGRNWLEKLKVYWASSPIQQIVEIVADERHVADLVNDYSELFEDNLGTVKGVKASIKLFPGTTPTFLKASPAVYSLKDSIGQELDRLEAKGALKKVMNSRWDTPIVVVTKPDRASSAATTR